ncbi:MAG TPA: bactofilin [Bacillota bacterium]|nr:bactofilin [Bacillota bacterium]
MNQEIRHDVEILGVGSNNGGYCRDVAINGKGKINGDLDCIEFCCDGIGEVNGKTQAVTIKVNGRAEFKGGLSAEEMKVNGQAVVNGAADLKELQVEGWVTVRDNLATEDLEVKGAVTVDGDCNAETFLAKGYFTIGGLLNAGTINVKLYGPGRAREIGGGKIDVKRGHVTRLKDLIKSLFLGDTFAEVLTAESIEGDDIYLEYTRAKVVRGSKVRLGPGCEVDLVEYRESYQADQEAKVGQSSKV